MTLPESSAAIVIRGGSTNHDPDVLLEQLIRLRDAGLPMCVSVFAEDRHPEDSLDQALEGLCRRAGARWGKISVSSVGRLRDAGFELADERNECEAENHFNVYFPSDVTRSHALRFISAFDKPMPNPWPAAERKAR